MNHYCRVCRHTHPLWTQYRNSSTIVCGYCGHRERDYRVGTRQLQGIIRPNSKPEVRRDI